MRNRVRIIAPAGKHKENSEALLQQGIKLLEENGFIISVQDNIFGDVKPNFFANTKEARLKGLRDAILADDVDIILAFRGGYGCGEIADLCMDIKPVGEKILIGFSDITYLHFLFNQHYKIPSIHGAVITASVEKYPHSIKEIVSILQGEKQKIALKPLTNEAKGEISGEIVGGNLTILDSMIGTKLHPNLLGKILLLEDVGEPGYRISRLFNHLEKARLLDGIKAIILGDFTDGDECLNDSIKAFVQSRPNLPIYRAEGIGHGAVNKAVVLGKEALIRDGVLEFGLY